MYVVSKCPNCGADKSIELEQNNMKRKGMCERILLTCVVRKSIINELDTSPRFKTNETGLIVINLRSAMATTSTGGGLTSLRNYDANGKKMLVTLPKFGHFFPTMFFPIMYSFHFKHALSLCMSRCARCV